MCRLRNKEYEDFINTLTLYLGVLSMTNATQTSPIDLQEYLEYTYPKLTDNEINLINERLKNSWDYSHSFIEIEEKVRETATLADIQLFDEDEEYTHDSEGC